MDISTSVVYVSPNVRESSFRLMKVRHLWKVHRGAAFEEAGPVR
jgi:hypothetical protein